MNGIDCVECGSPAVRPTRQPGQPAPQVGDLVLHECEDCGELFLATIPEPLLHEGYGGIAGTR